MKHTLENINLSKKSKTPLSIELITDNERINIIVNQKRSTFELARETRKIFKSIVPTSKLIVLDFRKMEEIEESLYLTLLNIALVSQNDKIKIQLLLERRNLGCISCYHYLTKGNRKCRLCKAQLEDQINQINNE